MARQDHYSVLGVAHDAPDEVIRAAYRALAAKYHPDRNPGDRDAELKLKRLNAAFRVLGDAETRAHYDELTQGPDGGDEPSPEPAKHEPRRSKVPEEPAPHEPRWRVPGEDERARSAPQAAESSRTETATTRAAGVFTRSGGRVVFWALGLILTAAVLAWLPLDGCEARRGDYKATFTTSTAVTTMAAAATTPWIEITQPDYRIAFPETPGPATTATVKTNWGVVTDTIIEVRRPSGTLYQVEQVDYPKGTLAALPLADRERTLSEGAEGDLLVALGPTTVLGPEQPASVGNCNGRRASATVGPAAVRWVLCVVGARSYMAMAVYPTGSGGDSEATSFLDSFAVFKASSSPAKPSAVQQPATATARAGPASPPQEDTEDRQRMTLLCLANAQCSRCQASGSGEDCYRYVREQQTSPMDLDAQCARNALCTECRKTYPGSNCYWHLQH